MDTTSSMVDTPAAVDIMFELTPSAKCQQVEEKDVGDIQFGIQDKIKQRSIVNHY